MEAQLVSYQTAELANKKGYPHKTRNCYVKRSSYTFSILCSKVDVYDDVLCFQPSQEELKRWLRDQHGIQVEPYSLQRQSKHWINWGVKIDLIPLKDERPDVAKTYESVLEIGLQHALNTLKDEKKTIILASDIVDHRDVRSFVQARRFK